MYINPSKVRLTLATPYYTYIFPGGSYFAQDSDLAPYVATGQLVQGSATSVLATRIQTYVPTAVECDAEADVSATQVSVDAVQVDVTTIDGKIDIIDTNVDTIDTNVDTIDTNVDTIDTNVDTIDGKIDIIDTNVDTIDTNLDTTLEEVREVERHFHNVNRWAGVGPGVGEVYADWNGMTGYTIGAGAGAFGVPVQILGANDTPVQAGMTWFDPDQVVIHTVVVNATYRGRIIFGTYKGVTYDNAAAAIAAGAYDEEVFVPTVTGPPVRVSGGPKGVRAVRLPAGSNLWMDAKSSAGAGNLILFVSIHEYPE